MRSLVSIAVLGSLFLGLSFSGCGTAPLVSSGSGGGSGSGSSGGSGSSTAANIVLKGSLHSFESASGNIALSGELQNTGRTAVPFAAINFTFKNNSGVTVGQSSWFVYGTVMNVNTTTTNTALGTSEAGPFFAATTTRFSSVESVGHTITFQDKPVRAANGSMEVSGTITVSSDSNGNRKYAGQVKNPSGATLTFAQVFIVSRNAAGQIIDITGATVIGQHIGPGQTKAFEIQTTIPSAQVADFSPKFTWTEQEGFDVGNGE